MSGVWIEDLAWPEVGAKLAAGWPVIVPIGARAKEHGHHLPMQTDYLVARALADGVAAQLPVLVAPVVDFGYYPAFLGYPGSQHLGRDVHRPCSTTCSIACSSGRRAHRDHQHRGVDRRCGADRGAQHVRPARRADRVADMRTSARRARA